MTYDRRTRTVSGLVLGLATLALLATSPAEDELRSLTTFTVDVAEFEPLAVTVDVSPDLLDGDWEVAPLIGLRDLIVRDVAGRGVDRDLVRVGLAPADGSQFFLEPAPSQLDEPPAEERPEVDVWQLRNDVCDRGCELEFVLTVTAPSDVAAATRVEGALATYVRFEEGGFFSGTIPDGARFDLVVHDRRFRPPGQPVAGLGAVVADLDEAEVTSEVVLRGRSDLVTLTRTGVDGGAVFLDGRGLEHTVTLAPMGTGPTLAVAPGDVVRVRPFSACSPDPRHCVVDFRTENLSGAVRVVTTGTDRAEPGATRGPLLLLEGDRGLYANDAGSISVEGGTTRVVERSVVVALSEAFDSSTTLDASVTLALTRLADDGGGAVLVQLGDATRLLEPGITSVDVGAWMPAGARGDRYAAPLPFEITALDEDDVHLAWDVAVELSEFWTGASDGDQAEIVDGIVEIRDDVVGG